MIIEEVVARGHENIRATHKTTLEITRERELTPRGDCIIGVCADKSIFDLSPELKSALRRGLRAKVTLYLPDYSLKEEFYGFGCDKLTFTHKTDIVIRKSRFVCNRTLLISATKAARDLNREFVELLKDRKTEIVMILEV